MANEFRVKNGLIVHDSTAVSGATPNANADNIVVDASGDSGMTIFSGASSTGNIFFGDGDSATQGQILYAHSSNSMRLVTAGSERMRIASNGDIGINQPSPAALLHIKGSENSWDKHIRLENHDTTDYGAILVDSQGMKFRTFTNGDNFYFRDNDNTTTLFIKDGGKVGIGTTSPLNKLQVDHTGADGDNGIMVVRADSSTANNDILGGLGFDSTDGNVPSSVFEASAAIVAKARQDHSATAKGGYMEFRYSTSSKAEDATNTCGMTFIDGKLAVNNGGLHPLTTLTLYHSGGDFNDGLTIIKNSATVASGDLLGAIGFDGRDGNAPSRATEASAGIAAFASQDHSATEKGGHLTFFTAPDNQDDDTASLERMRITQDGRVGIGTTEPDSQLDVRGPAGSPGTLTLSTDELTVVDGDKLGKIDFVAPNESDDSDSNLVGASIWAEADAEFNATTNKTELVFATGESEAAVEEMRLTWDGKLGVGTSSPTRALDVNGDIRVRGNNILDNSGSSAITFDGSGNTSIDGTLTIDDISISGSTISDSGDFTIDSGGDISLDADGADVILKDGGTEFVRFTSDSGAPSISAPTTTGTDTGGKNITFKGGNATGNSLPGSILFQLHEKSSTSGTSSTSLGTGEATAMSISNGGTVTVGIGNNSPTATVSGGTILDIRGPAGGAGILTLSTKEPDLVDGDIVGLIEFIAPFQTATGDSIALLASITAEADATHSSTVNTTDLVFKTATDAAATEAMRIKGNKAITTQSDLTVGGNLTVSGTTTTVDSTTVSIKDPIFELGDSSSDDNLDRGIKMKYNSSGAKVAFMGFDDSTGKFTMIPDATDSSSVFSGTAGTLVMTTFEGDLTGDVTGNVSGSAATVTSGAQSNITSLGTLTSLTGGTGDLVWDTDTLFVDSSADRVGIGVSGPETTLHVSHNATTTGPSGTAQLLVEPVATTGQDASIEVRGARNSSTTAVPTSIKFTNFDNDLSGTNILGAVVSKVTNHSTNVGSLILQTSSDGSSLSDSLTMTSAGNAIFSGNVGIGESSPAFPLEVEGFISTASGIVHKGDTNNTISFGTDTQSFNTAGSARMTIAADGAVNVVGAFSAATKSFDIEHPTKEGMRLHHGSLEGPEHGVYHRGVGSSRVVDLPDYWTGLVDEDSITVQLTPKGQFQSLYVSKIEGNRVYVDSDHGEPLDFYFNVYGERKDVDKMVVEY